MLKNIYLPKALCGTHATVVKRVYVSVEARIRAGQVLLELAQDGRTTQLIAESNGWIRYIAVREKQAVHLGELLFIIDSFDTSDYRPDSSQMNQHSELGKEGRRGQERAGQRAFGTEFSGELFDAPSTSEGGLPRSVKEHPLLQRMKESVPPKMSQADQNPVATERLAEDASHDPELKKQLSAALSSRLQIDSAPSAAPTLNRG